MYVQIDFEGLPVVIVNQAMKRHPMCIHYIREALTGSRRKKRVVTARPSATKSEDEADKQNDSENECTVNDRFSHSYAYGEEVPVKDFLVGHPEHKPQPESVVVIPIDRHKLEGPTTSHPPNDRDPIPHSNGLEMEHNDMQNSTTKLMTQFWMHTDIYQILIIIMQEVFFFYECVCTVMFTNAYNTLIVPQSHAYVSVTF